MPPPDPERPWFGADMTVRAIAALVMAALALAAVIAGTWPFAIAVATLGVIAAWEWHRITAGSNSSSTPPVRMLVHAAAAFAAPLATAAGFGLPALVVLAVLASVMGIAVNRYAGAGILITTAPAVALLYLRGDATSGALAILFLFLIVWVTDIAALLWGRSIGGVKLWPRLSPNKTWAGALGGAGSAMIAALLFVLAVPFLPSALWAALLALLLSVSAQAGDLLISAVKRRFGRKDASGLIPGHGGLLDRVDGMLLAAGVAALVGAFLDPLHPAAALLGLAQR